MINFSWSRLWCEAIAQNVHIPWHQLGLAVFDAVAFLTFTRFSRILSDDVCLIDCRTRNQTEFSEFNFFSERKI
ncbi:hypothetical protein BpHYR1_034141 [Brachionus plicatilis]|uniref:Uncharacterized protein n=1 Tax=Brachionus plicatilis TaxID=10195 RepID=A0A3M7S6N8_BRAPC|nr:hypothetical protein BpHYR1_034141 [Brachionus plicatilis]